MRRLATLVVVLAIAPISPIVSSIHAAPAYTPTVGQSGKDVIWVPTLVGGGWSLSIPSIVLDLDIEQKFQQISGRVELASVRAGLRDTRLRGDAIQFTLVDVHGVTHEFVGRVRPGRIDGKVTAAGVTGPWSATPRITTQE